MQSEYEKMIAGEIYRPQDEDLRKIRARSKEFQYRFNQEQDSDKRSAIIKEWFASPEVITNSDWCSVLNTGISFHWIK